jgi:mono/diheme cytochrome c family protein
MRFAVAVVALALLTVAPHLWAQNPEHSAAPEARWGKVVVKLPASMSRFPEGEGAEIANSQCLICHSALMVLSQPVQTSSQWRATINKMRTAYGAPLAAGQVDALAAYLSRLPPDGAGSAGVGMPLGEKPASPREVAVVGNDGSKLFAAYCAACHQAGGTGIPDAFPPLASSNWVNGREATVVQILLHGLHGPLTVNGAAYDGVMPEFGSQLSDAQIAAVLSYVRGQWGNNAGRVGVALVSTQRAVTATRNVPWNGDSDLAKMD